VRASLCAEELRVLLKLRSDWHGNGEVRQEDGGLEGARLRSRLGDERHLLKVRARET